MKLQRKSVKPNWFQRILFGITLWGLYEAPYFCHYSGNATEYLEKKKILKDARNIIDEMLRESK